MTSYAYRNDPYFLRNGFETEGEFNFPKIKRQEVILENISLIPYHLTKPNDVKNKNCGVHFFLDDYRFEEAYNHPEKAFRKICNYKFLLTPDFSLYREMPRWKQIENIAKSRWCGAYWQSKGKTVIPTLSWSGISSVEISASAIEQGSVIAVSTVGCKLSKFEFTTCYNKAIKIIKPSKIICMGKQFDEMQGDIVSIEFSRTKKISSEISICENTDLHINDGQLFLFDEFLQKAG